MRFFSGFAINTYTGRHSMVWLPESGKLSQDEPHILLRDEPRELSPDVLAMAASFEKDHESRRKLGHDCIAFALACQTNDTLTGQEFGVSRRISLGEFTESNDDDNSNAGDVILLAGTNFSLRKPRNIGHFMVKASVDDLEDLYFSKLGTSGPVVLSNLENMKHYYSMDFVGKAKSLYVVEAT
jgi:hypothetical protein